MDVMSYFRPSKMMPKWIKPHIKMDEWTWYCNRCLRKQTWDQFGLSYTGWPYYICTECRERVANAGHEMRVVNGSVTDSQANREILGSRKTGRVLKKMCGDNKPLATEMLASVLLNELGGAAGAGEFARRIIDAPNNDLWKARLYASLVSCIEASAHIDLENRRIEAAKESLKHKSLSNFSEDDLKTALGPLVVETLRKRPEVGIAALRRAGYIVERTPKMLAAAIKKMDERFRRDLMRELMK